MTEIAELIYRKEVYHFIRNIFLWNLWGLLLSKGRIYVVEIYIGSLKVPFILQAITWKSLWHSNTVNWLYFCSVSDFDWLISIIPESHVCKLPIFYCSEFFLTQVNMIGSFSLLTFKVIIDMHVIAVILLFIFWALMVTWLLPSHLYFVWSITSEKYPLLSEHLK